MKLEENKLREQSARQLNDRSKKAMEDMSKQALSSLTLAWSMISETYTEVSCNKYLMDRVSSLGKPHGQVDKEKPEFLHELIQSPTRSFREGFCSWSSGRTRKNLR
ncbi:uncharacterized protein AKAME5_001703600 [Lates japonicus]|uniref:Uncharacterized protein n=1 Tax=Lates japonicus TaxID=270547 RepID=A0AAD3RCT2_LATJO|nr:uncharacterized protein AKAME5_001703600 [Lates japonicus]